LATTGAVASPTQLQQQRDRLNAEAANGLVFVQDEAEEIGRELFASQVTNFSISEVQFVTNLYEGFLQRGPDTSGLNFWVNEAGTNNSTKRQNVLHSFAESGPFKDLAGTLYREVFWLIHDHLGTPRMLLGRTGSLTSVKRHDYLPFGEELYASVGSRSTGLGYLGGDGVRQQFTSQERDVETGLDYFFARYYSSTQGRFTSVDPSLASSKVLQPQSWNRYSYVLNNPLKFIDPTGLIWGYQDFEENGEQKRRFRWFDGDKVGDGFIAYTDPYYDSLDGRLYLNPNGPAGLFDAGSVGGGLFTINTDPYIRRGWILGPTPEQYNFYMRTGAVKDHTWDIVSLFIPGRMGAKALGATLATKAATKAATEAVETGTTTLFRAVSHAEFEQIMKTGTFQAGRNSVGGKYFAESVEDAARWGEKLEGKGNFRIIDAQIPTVKANEFMRWERLDNIGPARYAELDQLRGVPIRPVN
jgi:RHS repeat-associated protein